MHISERQRSAAVIGAVGIGAFVLAQAWRRRNAYDFNRKTVVITGGSRGLGLVMARALAAEGAKLALLARDEDELERAAADIRSLHPDADVLTLVADIRRRYDVERAVAQTFERFGSVDVVINNAGTIQVGPIEHMKLSDFEDAMNTHFWGPLYVMLAALPYMRRQGHGRIANISSIGGKIALPHLVPYSASKFALVGLSDGLRAELAKYNICLTTVCPGLMRTGSPVNAMFKGKRPQEFAWFTISDSLPLASIDARRAARQIIDACRYGDAELIVGFQANMAAMARTMFPEVFADAMALINRLLPGPSPAPDADRAHPGREHDEGWDESPLTAPTYRAAERNNEM
jgi:NAD(P)-dependent dehydrogenase (short-subunit alcohol dehydrogenase family)